MLEKEGRTPSLRHSAHLKDAVDFLLHPEPGGQNSRFKWMMEDKSESFPKISHLLLVRVDSKVSLCTENTQTGMHHVE